MELSYQWRIGDDVSEWYTKSFVDSEKIDMGNRASAAGCDGKLVGFDVSLKQDFGVKPIVVEEGQAITILLKSESEHFDVYYGYRGEDYERKKISE